MSPKPTGRRTEKQHTGQAGELRALEFLLAKGYQLVAKNHKLGKHEVDLIMKQGEVLVFVEVKLRKNNALGYPEDYVTPAQVNSIKTVAVAYMDERHYLGPVRYDIVAITGNQHDEHILHLEDAF